MVVPEIWAKAEKEAQDRCAAIQGFTTTAPDGKNRHYIRDVGRTEGQFLWSKLADPDDYWKIHDEMMEKIRLFQIEMIVEAYDKLTSET